MRGVALPKHGLRLLAAALTGAVFVFAVASLMGTQTVVGSTVSLPPITNNTNQTANDLHLVLSGTGGSLTGAIEPLRRAYEEGKVFA